MFKATKFKPIISLVLAILILLCQPEFKCMARGSQTPTNGLKGDYSYYGWWNSDKFPAKYPGIGIFTGDLPNPVVTRIDSNINFSWGSGKAFNNQVGGFFRQAVDVIDYFSARWTGSLEANDDGAYSFVVDADDGVRVYINDTRVIDGWTPNSNTWRQSSKYYFQKGQKYNIKVEYFENVMEAHIRLYWEHLNSSGVTVKEIIPSSCFYPDVTTSPATLTPYIPPVITPTPTPTVTPSPTPLPEDEYGDSIQTAKYINVGSSTYGIINTRGDADYFKFFAFDSGQYTISTSSNFDTSGYLYDSAGNEIAHSDDSLGSRDFRIEQVLPSKQDYYIKVQHFSGAVTGRYTLNVSLVPSDTPINTNNAVVSVPTLVYGTPDACFSKDLSTSAVAVGDSAYIQLGFDTIDSKSVSKIKIAMEQQESPASRMSLMSHTPNGPQAYVWSLVAADSQGDMDNGSGTYVEAISDTPLVSDGIWKDIAVSTSVSRNLWRLNVRSALNEGTILLPHIELYEGSGQVFDTIPPASPVNLIYTSKSSSTVTLSWSPAVGAESYKLYRNGALIGSSLCTYFTDLGLTPGSTYSYTVKAVDATENASDASSPLEVQILSSDPPTGSESLTCTGRTDSSVSLSWAVPSGVTVGKYEVYRNNEKIADALTNSYTDISLLPGKTYGYSVRVIDSSGAASVFSYALCVATLDAVAPDAPQCLTYLEKGNTSVKLHWGTASDNVQSVGYVVYRDGVAVGTTDAVTFVDSGLETGTVYVYTVKAKDASGNLSAASSPFSVKIGKIVDPEGPVTPGGAGSQAVFAGKQCSLFVKDGNVWVSGNSLPGSSDLPTSINASPIQVSGITNVKSVAQGWGYNLVLKNDGTVWFWGNIWFSRANTPTQILELTNIKAIATGDYYIMALKDDGTIWTLGDNTYGQLGNGKFGDYYQTPVQVVGLTDVKAISAGGSFSMALKDDGTVWAWGDNHWGQIGDGTTQEEHLPTEVPGLANVSSISVGYSHNVIAKQDGTVWEWGKIVSLTASIPLPGTGLPVRQVNSPVQVAGLSNASSV